MIFQKSLIANSVAGAKQWQEVQTMRKNAAIQEEMFVNNGQQSWGQVFAAPPQGQMATNAGLIPQDVYQEFDNITVTRMRSDDGDTFLNDLLPLSSSVNIGKLVSRFRQASDAGNAQTSMTGQTGVLLDQVEYTYDGTIIPVHDTGFGRNWREWNAQQSEGFDALIDDQRESVATLRTKLCDTFLDGHKDKQGNTIVVDGLSWTGMRNDSRVAQVDLGAGGVNFDFTDTTKTYSEIEDAFKEVRDTLWITNKCEQEATYYVSREIMSNIERESSENASMGKVLQRLAGLTGVASIKVTSKLTGNELMGYPLDSNRIRPKVGMAVNTVSMPRALYNDNYNFVVWAAIGWQIRTDFADNTCALFAQA